MRSILAMTENPSKLILFGFKVALQFGVKYLQVAKQLSIG